MIGMIILAHLVGDYLLQTDWMATEKTKRWSPAIAHGFAYTVPFLLITQSPLALGVICGTHIVIDHYRLARHVVWAKNMIAPARYRHPWRECVTTGYHSTKPMWLAGWLMIITDNTLHLLINYAAVRWL